MSPWSKFASGLAVLCALLFFISLGIAATLGQVAQWCFVPVGLIAGFAYGTWAFRRWFA